MKSLKWLLFGGIVVIGLIGGYFGFRAWQESSRLNSRVTTIVTPPVTSTPTVEPTAKISPTPTIAPTPTPIPSIASTINLNVPFTSQAPEANWDEFHGEACEEASILMAQWYALGKVGKKEAGYANRIPVAEAEKALIDIVAWEKNNLPGWIDTTAEETARIGREFLGLGDIAVVDNPTAADFRRYLNQNKIIVLPAAGRVLANPYYRAPGPPYHMIVIRGYTSKGFITNDPGTRHGEGYVYSEATIMDAMHDWTGSTTTINTGLKRAIIVGKEN